MVDVVLPYIPPWLLIITTILKILIICSFVWSLSNLSLFFYWLFKKNGVFAKKKLKHLLIGVIIIVLSFIVAFMLNYFVFGPSLEQPFY